MSDIIKTIEETIPYALVFGALSMSMQAEAKKYENDYFAINWIEINKKRKKAYHDWMRRKYAGGLK
jgi:hypothetical protein